MSTTTPDSPLRSDAQRTRDRLLDAAADLLEAGGAHFTLPDLARQAGVGTATAYRHFTDVAELLVAVEVRSIAALTAAVTAIESDQRGAPGSPDARGRFEAICSMWVARSTRESAAVRFLRSPEGVLQRAHRGDPSITGLLGVLTVALAALVAESMVPEQDLPAAVLVWITLFDERIVIDLGRTHGWTVHRISDYLSRAVLGALGAT